MVLVEYAYVTEYPFWVLRESGNTWLNTRTRIHDKHIWCKLRMVVCRVEKGKKWSGPKQWIYFENFPNGDIVPYTSKPGS